MKARGATRSKRRLFPQVAWPGLAGWLVFLVAVATGMDLFLLQVLFVVSMAFASGWGLWWGVVAVGRRSVVTGLAALATLSYPTLMILLSWLLTPEPHICW